jgi:hypothetical protein
MNLSKLVGFEGSYNIVELDIGGARCEGLSDPFTHECMETWLSCGRFQTDDRTMPAGASVT